MLPPGPPAQQFTVGTTPQFNIGMAPPPPAVVPVAPPRTSARDANYPPTAPGQQPIPSYYRPVSTSTTATGVRTNTRSSSAAAAAAVAANTNTSSNIHTISTTSNGNANISTAN